MALFPGCMYKGVIHASDTEWSDPMEPCRILRCEAGALAQGDVAQALTHVEPILVFVAQNGACGDDTGFTPGLTCWRVLDLAADPRAAETLRLVHSALQAKAATITDAALHHSYVNKLAENREIVAAWAAHGGVP